MAIKNDKRLKQKRRELRRRQTDAEKKLWSLLRNRRLNNEKFFRQYSLGPYILDYYCPKKMLAIELDGRQHNQENQVLKDEKRNEFLQQHRVCVLRFWNHDVLTQTDAVVAEIYRTLEARQKQ